MKKFISKIIPQIILNRLRRYLKNKRFKNKINQMSRLKESDFIDGLEKVGIEAGDTIFVHCSLSNLGFIENGSLDIINAMKEVITSKGNIIIPSFSISQSMEETLKTKTYSFNVLKTNLMSLDPLEVVMPSYTSKDLIGINQIDKIIEDTSKILTALSNKGANKIMLDIGYNLKTILATETYNHIFRINFKLSLTLNLKLFSNINIISGSLISKLNFVG